MSVVARKTVVAGGVVYPAGAAVPDDVAERITAAGVFADGDAAVAKVAVGNWAANVQAPTVEEISAAAAALGFVLAPSEETSSDASSSETKDDSQGNDDDPDEDVEPIPTPVVDYSDKAWTVDKLKAEISTRNSYREPDAQLSTDGKRSDLIAVLTADDARD
jgi:hypothetical protein